MKKVKIGTLMLIWTVVSAAIIAVMFIAEYTTQQAVANERETESRGMSSLESAAQLQRGSDTLTYSVWRFAATGDSKYAESFLYERNVSKSRDEALELLRGSGLGSEVLLPAESAKRTSDELLEKELYAIRLVYEGTETEELPADIEKITLTPEDEALTDEEKLQKARDFVFGPEYQEMKQQISGSITEFYGALEDEIAKDVGEAASGMDVARGAQLVSQLALLAWLLALLAMVYRYVVRPIARYSRGIENRAVGGEEKELVPTGLYETRRLGDALNRLSQQVRERDEALQRQNRELRRLSQEDFLTKVSSRLAAESYINGLIEGGRGQCFSMVMLDLDYFKSFNDRYGHPAGDEALKLVAAILKETAESMNGIAARIGGEEFASVLPGADRASTAEYAAKVLGRIAGLRVPLEGGGTACLAASLGGYVHRGGSETLKEIYRNADRALYRAKETGRARYVDYEDTVGADA